jgi:hypothetical protein
VTTFLVVWIVTLIPMRIIHILVMLLYLNTYQMHKWKSYYRNLKEGTTNEELISNMLGDRMVYFM